MNNTKESGGVPEGSQNLKRETVRGALASGIAQVVVLFLRTGSLFVMARLLTAKDFGLFGMVVAFTGFLSLFRDFGLSMASVTRASVSEEQLSALFWVNVLVGFLLTLLCVCVAPLLAVFYAEPCLFQITIGVGVGFCFLGAGAQHRAILQRSMRFTCLGMIDVVALVIGIISGIALAVTGLGYWALVALTVGPQIAGTGGVWLASRWIPGAPRRAAGVRSMLWFGSGVTFNSLIVYVAYNLDKVLVGRFWGTEALGIYGRAYQLINLPIENINTTVAQVAYPALSRLQNDPVRLRSYFLRGYSLFLALLLPLSAACALFAEDIITVLLGAKWLDCAPIFRLLTPTMVVFALINPCAWVLVATGRVAKSVKMALIIAPAVVVGYTAGLDRGPEGVAVGFSAAMAVVAVPLLVWAHRGSSITGRDIIKALAPAVMSIAVAAAVTYSTGRYTALVEPVLLRLVVETGILFGVFWAVLLFPLGQRQAVMTVFREFRPSRKEEPMPETIGAGGMT